MQEFALTEYHAVAIAAVVIFVGRFLLRKVPILKRYCIPVPVIGGLVFSLLNLLFYVSGIGYFTINTSLQTFFMSLFFCTVGFSVSFKLLYKSGVQLIPLLLVTTLIIVIQNSVGCSLASFFGLDAKLGLAMGSIPLVGGHGTAGSFGPLLESTYGVENANTVAIAVATFGLVAGSLIGGPIAKALIVNHQLVTPKVSQEKEAAQAVTRKIQFERMLDATFLLMLAVGAGSVINNLFSALNVQFPFYIGAMILACLLRNTLEWRKVDIPMSEIQCLGAISLDLFLGMALVGVKLWQLAGLATAMVTILAVQTLLMAVAAYFLVFSVMGRDYEAACFSAGVCGFGLGATPNAIANIDAVNRHYGPSPRALFVIPIVGGLFIDFINVLIITFYVNWV